MKLTLSCFHCPGELVVVIHEPNEKRSRGMAVTLRLLLCPYCGRAQRTRRKKILYPPRNPPDLGALKR